MIRSDRGTTETLKAQISLKILSSTRTFSASSVPSAARRLTFKQSVLSSKGNVQLALTYAGLPE
jgi:hypothetical protein